MNGLFELVYFNGLLYAIKKASVATAYRANATAVVHTLS
jgi:hypothetical protein